MKALKPFDMPPEVLDQILNLGTRRTYKRGHLFSDSLSPVNLFYVRKGAMRNFSCVDECELTYWINVENEFSCAVNFFTGTTNETFLEAIETSEVIELRRDQLLQAYLNDPAVEHFGRLLAEYQLRVLEHNHLISSDKNAFNRYNMFLDCYPHLNGRVPLKYIASLLNLDPATLSRVRARMQHSNSLT